MANQDLEQGAHLPTCDSPIDSQLHWTQSIGTLDACANCNAVRIGDYCLRCGQKHLSGRLKFGELVGELLSKLSNLEKGLFHTFLQLVLRPGNVAKDYVCGKQRSYVNPLTYFFIAAALQLVALWLSQSVLHDSLSNSLQTNFDQSPTPERMQDLEKLLGGNPADVMADVYIAAMQQAYTYAALLFFCFPYAVSLRWLHRLTGERFRLGETMVYSLYTFGQMLVFTAVFTPFTSRIGSSVQMMMGVATYFVFSWHSHSGFFKRTWRSRVLTIAATVFSAGTFIISIMAIFVLSFLVHVVFAARAAAQ